MLRCNKELVSHQGDKDWPPGGEQNVPDRVGHRIAQSGDAALCFILDRSQSSGDRPRTSTGAEQDLRRFRKQHKWDPFLDNDKLDNIDDALGAANGDKEAAIDETIIEENSPYAEVRAAVCGQFVLPCINARDEVFLVRILFESFSQQ